MQDYGILLNEKNIKLHRFYFQETVRLIGVQVGYRAPIEGKRWTTYAEIDMNYQPLEWVGCLFDDHPTQYTMKKLGWVSELTENACIISVPYDLHDIQVGALFVIPSGIDNAKGRLFKVSRMSNIMLYPASITCEIVPEYMDTYDNPKEKYHNNSFTLLNSEEDDY